MAEDGTTTTWDGYSDYQSVSQCNARTIHDAVEAFAQIERGHKEGVKLGDKEAARAGSRIMTAAINVQTELAAYEDENEEYADLLESFNGPDGYVSRLRAVRLGHESPDWLLQFVRDIRRAGFMLGYLKAGREETKRDAEGPEEQAREMFADL